MSEAARIREIYERRAKALGEKYSLLRPGELYMAQRREQACLALLRSAGYASLAGIRVLEIGCGRAERLADFMRWGARLPDLFGVDLVPRFLAEAREKYPGLNLALADASRLPFPDGHFDLVVQFTVFTSVLDAGARTRLAREMMRVCSPGGALLWYDFRYPNPWNPEVRAIGRAEMQALFPQLQFRVNAVTLLPPIARRLAPLSFALCRVLESIPYLRSHYVALGTRRP